MREQKLHKKVYVGMSGGVDSSVSAALLKTQGYDVTGVFIKVWQPDFMPCSWKEDRRDVMRVAAHLDIPFITLDLEKEYKQEVVDYMINEYKKGRTPNPDVMCNLHVKFGGFYEWARKEGADFVATGHYARVEFLDGNATLAKGQDDNKDQSYFLWTITPEKLAHTLFPVGDIPKPEVRKLAQKYNLPNADKKDSQGLCFIGKVNMKEFLKHFIEEKKGDVLNSDGEIIGFHEGSLFYTLGERHGFTITQKTPEDAPYFVIAKDTEENSLTVSQNKNIPKAIFDITQYGSESSTIEDKNNVGSKLKVTIVNTNWIVTPDNTKTYEARVRYRGTLHNVSLKLQSATTAEITFLHSTDTLAPGQSIVVYDGDTCIGGGVIA